MQQTADVEILWITVDVAAECLPAYGSFFSSAAVVDGNAIYEVDEECLRKKKEKEQEEEHEKQQEKRKNKT